MVDLVNFFVFPIRKLPILVLDSVELDGNGKSDHQQLKQEDGWGTAAFPFLSTPTRFKLFQWQCFARMHQRSLLVSWLMIIWWWHQPAVGLSYVDSVFSALERYFQITPTYHRETLYLLEDIFKWWHINPEFRRLPGCQVAGFFWKGFRWPALGLMPTKMQHLSPFNYVQQVIYESNEGSVTHQVSIKWIYAKIMDLWLISDPYFHQVYYFHFSVVSGSALTRLNIFIIFICFTPCIYVNVYQHSQANLLSSRCYVKVKSNVKCCSFCSIFTRKILIKSITKLKVAVVPQ